MQAFVRVVSFVLLMTAAVAVCAQATPVVSSLTPSSGEPGASITIAGSNFTTTAGTVTFNGTTASVSSWSDTSITALVPNGATSGNAVVTAGGLQSNGAPFTVIVPAITSLSPTSGAPGASVTISGSGFGASQGAGYVTFNGQAAPITSWSDTSIGVSVPGGATTGNVVVSHGGLSSSRAAFTVAPIVLSVTPNVGTAGTSITITGVNFTATQGTVTITGPSATVTSWSNTSITATVPNAAALYAPVTVTAGGMTSNSNVYFNVAPPHITSVSPSTGPVGTQITVHGSGFQATQGNNSITINGYSSALSSVTWSDTQITGTIAYGIAGPVQVTVNNVGSNLDLTFSTPNPVVTSVSPTSGTVGAQVRINGSGFGATQGSSLLWFCCWASESVVSWSDTQIVAAVPAGATTGSVIPTVGGVNSNSNVNFNVSSASIYSVTPKAGPIGTQVTVSGAGFGATQGSSTLQFYGGANGPVIAAISSWSDTQIVATVPSGTQTGSMRVIVGGQGSNQDVGFTVGTVLVSSVSPTSVLPGQQFQVNGSGFGATEGSSTIYFGSWAYTPTVVSWSDTQITAKFSAVAATRPIIITVGGSPAIQMLTSPSSGLPFPVFLPPMDRWELRYRSTETTSGQRKARACSSSTAQPFHRAGSGFGRTR